MTTTQMLCEERLALIEELRKATCEYAQAACRIPEAIRFLSKAEFRVFGDSIETTHARLKTARQTLSAHHADHGCHSNGGILTGPEESPKNKPSDTENRPAPF